VYGCVVAERSATQRGDSSPAQTRFRKITENNSLLEEPPRREADRVLSGQRSFKTIASSFVSSYTRLVLEDQVPFGDFFCPNVFLEN
jgi:hypothetical protein